MNLNTDKIAIKKPKTTRKLIIDAIRIINATGLPIDDLTVRRLEKMAMSFLALCSMTTSKKWSQSLSITDGNILGTRDIIHYINQHFKENISPGSYDDIRRKDLVRLVGMGLVVKSADNPNADTNDGTRGYAIEENFSTLIKSYGSPSWNNNMDSFEIDQEYVDLFQSKRNIRKLKVELEKGVTITLDDGPHNKIQKAIIEKFLPIYGYNAQVLYIGDTSKKQLHKYSELMIKLGLDIKDRGMLPDIIAFSKEKNWIYLIEAVHSSNPLNPERCIEIQRTVLKNCPYGIVFVTAFLTRNDFAKWVSQIAWETEVWLADTPEHMIHFNGDKFLGPQH